jgi:hypothetical protein
MRKQRWVLFSALSEKYEMGEIVTNLLMLFAQIARALNIEIPTAA